MWHHNAESLESMLRSDRANITIEEKNKSTKKHFGNFRNNGKKIKIFKQNKKKFRN